MKKPIRKIHSKLTLSTRSPLKQVRSPSGAPPEPLEIQGGAPQVPFCFRLESAATHEGILCGKLPPCYVVAINYQPTGQSSGYSRATRQACIFLTPGALLAPAGRSVGSGRSGRTTEPTARVGRSVGRSAGRSVGRSLGRSVGRSGPLYSRSGSTHNVRPQDLGTARTARTRKHYLRTRCFAMKQEKLSKILGEPGKGTTFLKF